MLPASAIFPARPLHLACHRPRGEITMSLQQEAPGWWQGTVVLLAAAQIAGQVGLISLPGRHESSAAADQPERAKVVVATLDHPPCAQRRSCREDIIPGSYNDRKEEATEPGRTIHALWQKSLTAFDASLVILAGTGPEPSARLQL